MCVCVFCFIGGGNRVGPVGQSGENKATAVNALINFPRRPGRGRRQRQRGGSCGGGRWRKRRRRWRWRKRRRRRRRRWWRAQGGRGSGQGPVGPQRRPAKGVGLPALVESHQGARQTRPHYIVHDREWNRSHKRNSLGIFQVLQTSRALGGSDDIRRRRAWLLVPIEWPDRWFDLFHRCWSATWRWAVSTSRWVGNGWKWKLQSSTDFRSVSPRVFRNWADATGARWTSCKRTTTAPSKWLFSFLLLKLANTRYSLVESK